MTTPNTTIVFGPTGNVGSATARSIRQHGARVVLAMRDPGKSIPGLTADQEAETGFERIQADLSEPETIARAVRQTQAKRAFIYVTFAWIHAQVEINLEEMFGPNGFVAVRPTYFASNALWWKRMVSEREVKMAYPNAKFDWISPEDIGAVCGTLLAQGPQVLNDTKRSVIRLSGPELISLGDAVRIIDSVISKNIKITELNEQEGLEIYVKVHGLPKPVAKRMIEVVRKSSSDGGDDELYPRHVYEEAKDNVRKYAGGQHTTFHAWVVENKHEFLTN